MLLRSLLMSGASRATLAPQNDEGFEELDDGLDPNEGEEDVDLPDDEDQDPDAELDTEDDELPDSEDDQPPARQPSRADNRVAKATREAREAKERADRVERELAEIRRQASAPPPQPQETEQQLRERLSMMDPVDAANYLIQRNNQVLERQIAQMRFEAQDSADRTAYDSLAARKPIAAKLRDDVEKRLAEMRAQGTTAPRETVLRWVIGDRALANEGRASARTQRTAAANRDRQAARPPAGRGDAQTQDRRGGGSREKRLENVNI